MRYSEDHKAQPLQRIIDEAAQRFRHDGVGATGLQPLMKALACALLHATKSIDPGAGAEPPPRGWCGDSDRRYRVAGYW
jgi:hypothetical protein